MQKQNTKNTLREQAIKAAIGSIRCEGLYPSERTKKHLQSYSSGKISANQLHKNVLNEVETILTRSSD